ncbi:MAG: phosphopantetheine adenylyltransferase [Spirochaetes bacterium]|nr:phosphopantetheine adenylyltransferase [Spirochaetota bacterium]
MVRIAVGGTFDPLHDGHKALLKKAVELSRGGELVVGLTSDEMAKKKSPQVANYLLRCDTVLNYIIELGGKPVIIRLDDPYGPTIRDDFDFLIVSPETYPTALKINKIRKEKNYKNISIKLVDYVLAEDRLPISSTRIKKGEINKHGKVLNKHINLV